jgi:uncharacterized surface protein with fasciclin (FAS1) repeats
MSQPNKDADMNTARLPFLAAALMTASACAMYDGGDADDMTMQSAASAPIGVTITETVVDSPNHTALERLVVSAGLADTLAGAGPFTVFAPTDAAFAQVPSGTLEALGQPGNAEMLRGVLTYHVVPGRYSASDLISRIEAAGGTLSLTTVQGTPLTVSLVNGNVRLTDATGGTAFVTNPDIRNSNGIIHSIGSVLMPRS